MKYRNYKNIVNTQNAAKPMLAIDVNELDKDPFLINTPAGTIDMNKGREGIREHAPEDLITKITTVAPGDEGAKVWQEALDTFFCGDKELIDYVQTTVGLAAIRNDPAGNIKADKEKSTEKIDGAIATIMGLDRAIRCGNANTESVYDSRGILFIKSSLSHD